MDDEILQQLRQLEDNFFDAVKEGVHAMAAFQQRYSTFASLINTHSSPHVLESAFQVAQRISHVTEDLLALNFEYLSVQDVMNPVLRSALHSGSPLEGEIAPSTTMPSSWLLANLSNPYPSRKELQNLAKATNQTTHALISWFSTARQRIGWTALRSSQHFKGSKTKILEAATLYFEQNAILPHGLDAEFAKIEHEANKLYAEKSNSTRLMSGLDDRVKSLDPKLKTEVKEMKQREKQVATERAKEQHEFLRYKHFMELKQRQAEYLKEAFPERWSSSDSSEISPSSPESFRESSVVSDDAGASELDEVHTSPVIGAKRRRDDEVQPQHRKRTRPTPPVPTLTSLAIELLADPMPIASSNVQLPPTSSRKRRLSESSCQGLPKRLCVTLDGSSSSSPHRLNAVSSPLPSSQPCASPTAADVLDSGSVIKQEDFDLTSLVSWDLSTPLPADFAICVRDPNPLHAVANETLERPVSPSLFSIDGSTTDDDSDSESWAFSAPSSASPPALPEDLWQKLPQDDKTPTVQTFPVTPASPTKPALASEVEITSPERTLLASYHPYSAVHNEL